MPIALGIDTGGTYTDAVLVDNQTGEIFSTAKSLTTRHDLSIGVEQAIVSVLKERPKSFSAETINMVGLSTTLATNAIAEGHGAPVCLLLIGYDPELMISAAMKLLRWTSRPPGMLFCNAVNTSVPLPFPAILVR